MLCQPAQPAQAAGACCALEKNRETLPSVDCCFVGCDQIFIHPHVIRPLLDQMRTRAPGAPVEIREPDQVALTGTESTADEEMRRERTAAVPEVGDRLLQQAKALLTSRGTTWTGAQLVSCPWINSEWWQVCVCKHCKHRRPLCPRLQLKMSQPWRHRSLKRRLQVGRSLRQAVCVLASRSHSAPLWLLTI